MRELPPIVAVNEHGLTADGDDVNVRAARKLVRAGLMTNEPIRAQYPDGTIRSGTLVKITPLGMERLERELPVGLRQARGEA